MTQEQFQVVSRYCTEHGFRPDNLHKLTDGQLHRLFLEAQAEKEDLLVFDSLLDDFGVRLALAVVEKE